MARKERKSTSYNQKALWKTFHSLESRADKAWKKFKTDVRKNARSEILVKDQSELLLLLGECNYMASECMRIANVGKKRR